METLTATAAPGLKNQLIDEQVRHGLLTLVEGTGARLGKVFARGEFGHATKPTANGRRYPKKVWEKNIDRLQESLQGRKVLGELDHPSDGRTSLQRASHVITELRIEDDRVVGEAEILDTTKGRDLKAILKAGVPVGISSRGYGSTHPDGEGIEEVQDDYKLVTFDFVAEPADSTAYPDVFFEGIEIPLERRRTDEGSGASVREALVEDKMVTELREELSEQVLARIEQMRTEVEKQVRDELASDPRVLGAVEALRSIQEALRPYVLPDDVRQYVSEKDREIASLRGQLEEARDQIEQQHELIETLTASVREAGYRYHMEHLLAGCPADLGEAVRGLIPDVTVFESSEALTERVERALKELQGERKDPKVTTLKARNRELAENLERATETNRELALRMYAANRLQSHPKGAKIMRMLESVGFASEEQVDQVIETYREPKLDADDMEAVRDKVRRRLGGGREHLVEDEALTARSDRGINGLGMSLTDFRKLSGLEGA